MSVLRMAVRNDGAKEKSDSVGAERSLVEKKYYSQVQVLTGHLPQGASSAKVSESNSPKVRWQDPVSKRAYNNTLRSGR